MIFRKINTRRNVDRLIEGVGAGVNHISSQAPTAEMEMHVNPTGLTDGEVKTGQVQMDQAITLQAKDMTALAEKQGVPRKNPPSSTIYNWLSDFMRMISPIYTGSKLLRIT